MKSRQLIRHKTVKVGNHIIHIEVRSKTQLANPAGFKTIVTDNKGHRQESYFSVLRIQEAMDRAYVKFVKAYGG